MKDTAQHLRNVIAEAYPVLVLQGLSETEVGEKSDPKKWSKKEILGHLIDSVCNNQQKFVRTTAQTYFDFVGYAQNHWVTAQDYQTEDWLELLTFGKAYKLHLAHCIEKVEEPLRQIIPDLLLQSTFQNVYGV